MTDERAGMVGGLSVVTGCLLSMAYAWYARSQDDIVTYTMVIGTVTALFLAWASYGMPVEEDKAFDRGEWIVNSVLKSIGIIPMAGFMYYSIFVALSDLALFSFRLSSENANIVAPAVLATGFGILLYIVRVKQRFFYGVGEVSLGIVIAVSRAQHLTMNDELILAFLTASVFLIVRGFDNIDAAIKNKANNRILSWLHNLPKVEEKKTL